MGVRGALDLKLGVEKVAAGAAAGVTTPVTGPLGAAGAAYGAISGTGQTVQGGAEIVGAITGHVKEANDASDAISASTTVGGIVMTVATGGNVKAGAAAASVEQLGTGALKQEIFTHMVENGLAFIDLVTSGGDEK